MTLSNIFINYTQEFLNIDTNETIFTHECNHVSSIFNFPKISVGDKVNLKLKKNNYMKQEVNKEGNFFNRVKDGLIEEFKEAKNISYEYSKFIVTDIEHFIEDNKTVFYIKAA